MASPGARSGLRRAIHVQRVISVRVKYDLKTLVVAFNLPRERLQTWAYGYVDNSGDTSQSSGKSGGRKITFCLLAFSVLIVNKLSATLSPGSQLSA